MKPSIKPMLIIDFGPEYFELFDAFAMICSGHSVLPIGDGLRFPDFSKCANPIRAANEFGRRQAAAWVIMVGRQGIGGNGVDLRDLVRSFAQILSKEDGPTNYESSAVSSFLSHVMAMLWSFAQMVTPAQIVADAESYIALEREGEDDEIVVNR